MSVIFNARLWSNGEWRQNPQDYFISKYTGENLLTIDPNTLVSITNADVQDIDSYGLSPANNVAFALIREYRRLDDLGEYPIEVRICMDISDPTHHYISFDGSGINVLWYINENASTLISGCIVYPLPDSNCYPLMWTTANNINEISPLHTETPAYFGSIEYLGGYNKAVRSNITQIMAEASWVSGVSNPFSFSIKEYNSRVSHTYTRDAHKQYDAGCYAIIQHAYLNGTYFNTALRLIGVTLNSVNFRVNCTDDNNHYSMAGSTPTFIEYNGKQYAYSGTGTITSWSKEGFTNFSNPNNLTVVSSYFDSTPSGSDIVLPALEAIDLHTVELGEPIYVVLSYKYVPSSDVDPEDIPEQDQPPVPPQPDEPDPYIDPRDPQDPQDPGDPDRQPTTTGGGDPPERSDPDPVTPPDTPPSHAIDSHFVTLYTPSLSQLNSLAQYLWSSGWSVDTFKKILANPMDCILGLMIFPALSAPTGTKNIYVGNLDTGISMSYVSNQYVDVNCGSFEIKELYASYLDYSPYTKIDIYLPYIGMESLQADDVMGKTIQLTYRIDLLSSACVAFLIVDGTTLYTFTGSCGTSIPVSGTDWSNMLNGIINVAGVVGTAIVTGGASLTVGGGVAAASSMAVSSLKPQIRRGGSVASAAGLMSIQTPYLIITRPRMAVPENQNSYEGYPSYITQSLGSCVGYTEVESVHLEHVPATDEEIKEIEELLKGGVLF